MRARQNRALAAICDAFAPGIDGLPPASELGVPGAVADAVERAGGEREPGDVISIESIAHMNASRLVARL